MLTPIQAYRRAYYLKHKERIKAQNNETAARHPQAARDRRYRWAKTVKGRFACYKGGAKVRGLVFAVTLMEFTKLAESPCYYCGGEGHGVDRLDSTVGYIHGNVVPACSICNWMKQRFTPDQFIEQCCKIANTWKHTAIAA